MLTSACEAAGVTLGAYDRRILAWLAGWEPTICVVMAGLIARAAAGSVTLSPADLTEVMDALDHAEQLMRERAAAHCEDCPASPAGACGACLDQFDQADAYHALAERLGGAR